jgi:CubicO group peptidase (beta-lactamase class C family)
VTWTETDPAAVGLDPAGLERAVELSRARGAAAQLCVLRHGRVVLDRSFHCGPDSLFWIFSASKPFTAVLIYQLAERGLITVDDPVAAHWPEFARHGKAGITIRHVLAHRSGLPTAGTSLGDVLTMTHWRQAVRRLERAWPQFPPGTCAAYGYLSYGTILGELARRITGVSIQDSVRTGVLAPIGLADTYLGLPQAQWHRRVPLAAAGPSGHVMSAQLNRRSTRAAVIPAAGISTTARDLASFYQVLLADDGRLLRSDTLASARTPSNDGEFDRIARAWIRWSQGFQLGGPRADPTAVGPMGRLSSPRTFGHNGSNCCIGWADPDRQLAVAYLTNRLTNRRDDVRHMADVADALLSAATS